MRGRTNLGLYSGISINANAVECQIAGSNSIVAGDFVKAYTEITGGLNLDYNYSHIFPLSDGRFIMFVQAALNSSYFQVISKNGSTFSIDVSAYNIYRKFKQFISLGNDYFLCAGVDLSFSGSGTSSNPYKADGDVIFTIVHFDVSTDLFTIKDFTINTPTISTNTMASYDTTASSKVMECSIVKNGDKLYLLAAHGFRFRYSNVNYNSLYFRAHEFTLSGSDLSDFDITLGNTVVLKYEKDQNSYQTQFLKDSFSIGVENGLIYITTGIKMFLDTYDVFIWDGGSEVINNYSNMSYPHKFICSYNDNIIFLLKDSGSDTKIRRAHLVSEDSSLVFYDPENIIDIQISSGTTEVCVVNENVNTIILLVSLSSGFNTYKYLIDINKSNNQMEIRPYTLMSSVDYSYSACNIDENEFIAVGSLNIRDYFVLDSYNITTEILDTTKVVKPDGSAFLLGVAKTPGDPGDTIEVYIPS